MSCFRSYGLEEYTKPRPQLKLFYTKWAANVCKYNLYLEPRLTMKENSYEFHVQVI